MVDNKQQWKAWLYLSPAIILLLVFTAWPILNTLRMAFLNNYNSFDAVAGRTFSFGLMNFMSVLIDFPDFLKFLKNTMILCVTTVPLSTGLALVIAVCLNSIKPLQRLLQTIFFLPYVTNSIAIGMVFSAMFNVIGTDGNNVGVVNSILGLIGIDPLNWVNPGAPELHQYLVLIIYIVWNALPFKILILLGGLQSVN